MGSAPLFMLLGIGLMVVLGCVAYVADKKRREAMFVFAATRGWNYAQSDDSLIDRFDGSPFGLGHGRRATNVLLGSHDGRAMVAFDYRYRTTSGTGKSRSTQTHRFSVVALSMGAWFPALSVTPEGLVGRFFGRLTNSDIELESEDFNRAFTVTCPDRKFASDVLHPRMMEFLLQRPELAWRFDRDSMLMICSGQQTTGEIDAKLATMDAIGDQIPEFVWRQLKGEQ